MSFRRGQSQVKWLWEASFCGGNYPFLLAVSSWSKRGLGRNSPMGADRDWKRLLVWSIALSDKWLESMQPDLLPWFHFLGPSEIIPNIWYIQLDVFFLVKSNLFLLPNYKVILFSYSFGVSWIFRYSICRACLDFSMYSTKPTGGNSL